MLYTLVMKFEVFWKNPKYKIRPELKDDTECDYLVVGGGITGISVAYFLAKAGAKNIILIEKNYIASGATGKAAGTLVIRGESDLEDVIKKHGEKKGAIYWREIHEGLKGIAKIINEENIDCDAELQDTLYCSLKGKSYHSLLREYEAEKKLENTTLLLKGKDLEKEINTRIFIQGILSKNHGLSVNPLKFTQNLSKIVEKYGVKIYEKTAFIRTANNIAETHHGDIKYKKLIFAIDVAHPATEVKNIKSTIVITQPLTKKDLEKTGLEKKKIIFDAKKNYDYFKVTKDRRFLFGFGGIIVPKKHRKTDPHLPHLKNIKSFMKKLFPYLDLKTEYVWTGNFGITDDYDPLIEFKNDTISIAGAGTQVVCFMAAKHVVNKIFGKKSPLEDFFH